MLVRSDDREIVPPSPGIASLRVGAVNERDDGDYVCTAVSAAGTVAEHFAIRVERGDIGFESYGTAERAEVTFCVPWRPNHTESKLKFAALTDIST